MTSDPCLRASKQYERGETNRALNNLKRCQKQLKEELKKSRDNPDQVLHNLSQAYSFEGKIYFNQGSFKQALNSFKQALSYLDSITNPQPGFKGQILYFMGTIKLVQNDIKEALSLFNKSFDNYEKSKEYEKAVELLFRIGMIQRNLGKFETANQIFGRILKLKSKIKDKKSKQIIEGRSYLELSKTGQITGDKDTLKYLDKAKKSFSRAKSIEGEINTLLEYSTYYMRDTPKQLEYLLEAADLVKTIDDPGLKGEVYTQLGIAKLKMSDFEDGKNKLMLGLKFKTQAGDHAGTAKTLLELARISLITSRTSQDMENARNFAEQALDIYEGQNHKYGSASALELLASINAKLANLELAEKQAKKALKLYKTYNDSYGMARMKTQLGIIYGQLNQSENAINSLQDALSLFENNKQGRAEVLHLLGLQLLNKDTSRACGYLQESLKIYKSLDIDKRIKEQIVSAIDQAMNDCP